MARRFAFWGCSRPSLAGLSNIPSAPAKACATKTFAPPGEITILVCSQQASCRNRGRKGALSKCDAADFPHAGRRGIPSPACRPNSWPPRTTSPMNARKPPRSPTNATTLCASPAAAPPGAASPVPPKPLIDTLFTISAQFLGYNPRNLSFQSCAPGNAGKRIPA